MKEHSRLILSITLTVFMHAGFIFYVGQSAATVSSSSASKVMHFNLVAMAKSNKSEQKITHKKSLVPQPKDVKLVSKPPIVREQTPVIKKIFVEKDAHISTEIVRPKEKVIESKNNNETKVESLPVDTSTEPTENSFAHANIVKNESVTRQVDGTIVEKARFKSLPPPPNYPRRARLRGQQGTALIHAQLNIAGEVIKTRLAKSSGFSLLDKAAIKAVYQWDFMPGATELGNVPIWVEIPVQFILNPAKVS